MLFDSSPSHQGIIIVHKERIVIDGLIKTSNGKSFNEILAIGTKLHMELPAVVIY